MNRPWGHLNVLPVALFKRVIVQVGQGHRLDAPEASLTKAALQAGLSVGTAQQGGAFKDAAIGCFYGSMILSNLANVSTHKAVVKTSAPNQTE